MRTKQYKINDKWETAVLMAGGPGFKIYSISDGLLLVSGRAQHVVKENDPGFKPIMRYVNLKYQPLSEQEDIKKEFGKTLVTLTKSTLANMSLGESVAVTHV